MEGTLQQASRMNQAGIKRLPLLAGLQRRWASVLARLPDGLSAGFHGVDGTMSPLRYAGLSGLGVLRSEGDQVSQKEVAVSKQGDTAVKGDNVIYY